MTERQSTFKGSPRQPLDADQQWLLSPDSEKTLGLAVSELRAGTNLLKIVQRIRQLTTASRAALVLQLSQLRIRAAKKFSLSDQMYFSTKSYEQATSERIGRYKSSCLPRGKRVLDVGCGIGGDLIGLAEGRVAVAIELEPVVCAYAQRNAAVYQRENVSVLCGDAMSVPWTEFDLIHVDPDRRIEGRTTNAVHFQPALPDILAKLGRATSAIKIAPATKLARPLRQVFHREWIGELRECKQQVLWGNHNDRPAGLRSATIVRRDGTADRLSETRCDKRPGPIISDTPAEYIFEPHSVVLASRLVDFLAHALDLKRIAAGIAYLTGPNPVPSPFLSRFRILAVESAEPRRLSAALRSLEIGTVEWKKRGVETQTFEAAQRIKCKGTRPATVIVAPVRGKIASIICERVVDSNPTELA